ncbi:MAG: hypothetical protein ACXVW6_12340 [Nocardioidaceae bacterium]
MTYTSYVTASGQVLPGGSNCPSAGTPPVAQPQITNALVLRALRRVGLPDSDLQVQPANGRTLVNFATNFFTRSAPFDRTVRLLGQRVDLHVWPSSYAWSFGDGAATSGEEAGRPYPHLEVTHRYRRAGRVAPSVDTTYSARYRVNGGAWRDVVGTVTIPGAPVGLRVTEARPVLVGYH